MEIRRFNSETETLDTASAALDAILGKAQKESDTSNVLLLLSGGSSLKLLNRLSDTFFGEYLTITTLDERYSMDSDVNNFVQIQDTYLYEDARGAGASFISTVIKSSESLKEAAARYREKIEEWRDNNTDGIIIATLGIGEDGHVAGIFPYPEDESMFTDLFDTKGNWVVGYDAKEKNKYPERITPTMRLLRQIDHGIVYVAGDNKKEAMEKVLSEEGKLFETPARILLEMDDIQLFTDIK